MSDILSIVGVTASGKSALAMHIARTHPEVELVSIDSMQIYRGMDIGTAKPTIAERDEVPHHLIDIVEPSVDFTLSQFQAAARTALADIEARNATPLLVGGTGLHLRAVVDDLQIPGQYPAVAAELDAEPDTAALHRRLTELDPVAAARMEPTNRRRVLRALEVTLGSGTRFSDHGPGLDTYPATRFRMVAPRWCRSRIDDRIAARYQHQMHSGFLDEVRRLRAIPAGLSRTARQALGYRQLLAHLDGHLTLDQALGEAISATRRFARRQERWFRRDPRIRWVDAPVDAADVIAVWDEERAKPVG